MASSRLFRFNCIVNQYHLLGEKKSVSGKNSLICFFNRDRSTRLAVYFVAPKSPIKNPEIYTFIFWHNPKTSISVRL